ncbi:MAG: FHA domain-containing protein [Micrococcales bacterium]|nr:FHA domain-containing protein [Micrococcales bacterium]MCL2668847.1 FHA domain-containing protein [Micrococcales bacterium]
MSELTVGLLRLGYLALLWMLVLVAVAVLRRDLYGTRIVARRRRASQGPGGAPAPARHGPSRLVVTEGPLRGTIIPLGAAPVLLGRAPGCTLVLDDDYSSSRHARLYPQGEEWFVEDLGSTNGTYLGEYRVQAPMRVPMGTAVRIGQNVIELGR